VTLLVNKEFVDEFVTEANGDPEFARQARWFDGSILLESGEERLWLKLYLGRVIDTMDFIPPISYTFKISGAPEFWEALIDGSRKFADLTTPGRKPFYNDGKLDFGPFRSDMVVEGNLMEASRITEATFILMEAFVRTAQKRSNKS
jgi:hypothetical protein